MVVPEKRLCKLWDSMLEFGTSLDCSPFKF